MVPGAPEVDPEIDRRLRAASDSRGWVRFDRFQEIALYAPGAGFYDREQPAIGRRGAYYTAPAVSARFGYALALRLGSAYEAAGRPSDFRFVELGAGDGRLAVDVASVLVGRYPELRERPLAVVERSPRQLARLRAAWTAAHVPLPPLEPWGHVGDRAPFVGAVYANELLDALPVRRLVARRGRWQEQFVEWQGGRGRFVEAEERPSLSGLPVEAGADGDLLEVSPATASIVRELADAVTEGAIVFLDYGTIPGGPSLRPRDGTLVALRDHHPVAEPLASPGSADLSTFVDFEALRRVASASGLREVAFRRQSEALGAWGFPSESRDEAEGYDAVTRVRRHLATKNLALGFENFWVLELAAEGRPQTVPPAPPAARSTDG